MSESSKGRLTKKDKRIARAVGIAAAVTFVGGSIVSVGNSKNEPLSPTDDYNRRPAPTALAFPTATPEPTASPSPTSTHEPVLTPTPQATSTQTNETEAAGASEIKIREWRDIPYVSPLGYQMGVLKGYERGQDPGLFVSNGRQVGVTVSLLSEVDISTPEKEWEALRKFVHDEGEVGVPKNIGEDFEILGIQPKELAGKIALEFTSQNINRSTAEIKHKGYGLIVIQKGSDGLYRSFWFGASTNPKDNIEEFLGEARAMSNTFQFTSPEVLPAFSPITAKIIANRQR